MIVQTPDVGKVWVPEASAVKFGPAFPNGRRLPYGGIVSYIVRPGLNLAGELNDTKVQRGWGTATLSTEGLYEKWRQDPDESLQQLFAGPEDFARAVEHRLFKGRVHPSLLNGRHAEALIRTWHNERGVYGGRLIAKLGFAFVSSPTNSTVVAPNYVAVNKTSTFTSANFTFAKCGSSQSLSDGVANVGANVATNEFTANGLSRAIGSLSGYTDPTALDGIFAGTIAKTFTDSTGASTFYGVALVDASSTGAFNLFAESPQTSATLQISDTLTVTWTINA